MSFMLSSFEMYQKAQSVRSNYIINICRFNFYSLKRGLLSKCLEFQPIFHNPHASRGRQAIHSCLFIQQIHCWCFKMFFFYLPRLLIVSELIQILHTQDQVLIQIGWFYTLLGQTANGSTVNEVKTELFLQDRAVSFLLLH